MNQFISTPDPRIKHRDTRYKDADLSCIKAIVQAAINVELFTIPLYMTSMYSIVGLHQITSKGNDFYLGRYWPGSAPSPNPTTSNAKAFNLIFSVFIEEMLHLQLAANMASMIGVTPSFTSPALQSSHYGWICYNSTTIPHILNFQDCTGDYKNIKVQLAPMNAEQIALFLAIEETKDDAESHIDPQKISEYFEPAPFDWWKPDMTEKDLPLFGSIGWMYTCFWDYLEIEYNDGTTMIELLLQSNALRAQKDEFNKIDESHPMKEYPGIDATLQESENLKLQLMNVINSITSQGEGKTVAEAIRKRWNLTMPLTTVEKQFQPDPTALKEDYKGYNDKGEPIPISGQAEARIQAAALDHFEVFLEVKHLIGQSDFETWNTWHKKPANSWTAKMLNPSGTKSQYNIPSAEEVADALNELKNKDFEKNYTILSQAAVGTIKGITTQLDLYWQNRVNQFPTPAMTGSGDRISICWAITGQVPKLWEGIAPPPQNVLNHACQGMDLTKQPSPQDSCADVRIYHSCKGSNSCKTEGGCGFVQNSEGGGNCSGKVNVSNDAAQAGCGLPTMSAPANNKCGGHGGCAVPISASQLFPQPGEGGSLVMQLFNYGGAPDFKTEPLTQMKYDIGDSVYDIAWEAYCTVMKKRYPSEPAPQKPPASALRLAFPPST